jgi:IS1 family transposase
MIPHHVYYQLAILGLLWLGVILHYCWPSRSALSPQPPAEPVPPTGKRHRADGPQPCEGLTQQPPCAACAHAANHPTPPPPRRPEPMPPTNRRPWAIDTSRHFCPHTGGDYRGGVGVDNLHANGHPNGGPWRQFSCRSWHGYFLETHGTICHGKRLSVERIVRVLACLAEGLGIRATARVFEVDPHTVLQWLVEAAEQLQAFTRYCLCDVHGTQLQLDALYAVIRALKTGEISEEVARKRLEHTRSWVWTAIDPVSKLLRVLEVGPRTLEMAQCVVHQVAQRFAPRCVPVWLSAGFKGDLPAILGHFGSWSHPERRHDQGPWPKPRWRPLPGLLYAQVVKQSRRKRMVGGKHRVVFGTLGAIQPVLAACGWKINTACVERLNLAIRQRVAAVGRRVNTLCQGEVGLQQQLAVFHVYENFVRPHASLRQPLLIPKPTHGTGSAKVWRPCTPAMAAGLTDHVWTLREVLRFRVPPWPQSHAG